MEERLDEPPMTVTVIDIRKVLDQLRIPEHKCPQELLNNQSKSK